MNKKYTLTKEEATQLEKPIMFDHIKDDEWQASINCWIATRINGASASMACDYAITEVVKAIDYYAANNFEWPQIKGVAGVSQEHMDDFKKMGMDDIFKQIPGHNITLTLGGLEEGDEVYFKFRATQPIKINITKAKDGRKHSFTPENQKQKLAELAAKRRKESGESPFTEQE